MTRGNQRETDRLRAQQRKGKANPMTQKDKDGLTPIQRRERDAAALAAKQAAKAAAKEGK